jgi:hypothetical protein
MTLSVCDLFRDIDKWEGKIVTVKGRALFTESKEPTMTLLVPELPERCSFRNTTESAEIQLDYSGSQEQGTEANRSFRYDASSVGRAHESLRALLRRNPSMKAAIVTVDGLVAVRKYRLSEIPPGPPGFVPVHIPKPVTLKVQSFRSVEKEP